MDEQRSDVPSVARASAGRAEAPWAFRDAFAARLPAGDRAEAQAALAWPFGERWLPPPADEAPAAGAVACRLF